MRYATITGWWVAILSGLMAIQVLCAPAHAVGRIEFVSLDSSQPFKLSGQLYLPDTASASAPSPAIVLIHGTGGIDSRGTLYRGPLLLAGIAVFEVDFKTGNYTSPQDRPPNDAFVPAAFAALKQLRQLPNIDGKHIGIMGFSMGGGITIRTALEENRQRWLGSEPGFAALVGFYPVCRYFIPKVEHSSGLTGAPMIIFYGTADAYGEGKYVPELKALLQTKFHFDLATVEYANATHGFNLDAPPISYADPAATGGHGYMTYDAYATTDSISKVVEFLRRNLATR